MDGGSWFCIFLFVLLSVVLRPEGRSARTRRTKDRGKGGASLCRKGSGATRTFPSRSALCADAPAAGFPAADSRALFPLAIPGSAVSLSVDGSSHPVAPPLLLTMKISSIVGILSLAMSGALARADETDAVLAGAFVPPLAGEIIGALPGQIVGALPGQTVGPLPGQRVRALPGQIVRALPGQNVRSLPRQVARTIPNQNS